jgi:hypothetical protein
MRSIARIGRAAAAAALVSVVALPVVAQADETPSQQGTPSYKGQQNSPSQQGQQGSPSQQGTTQPPAEKESSQGPAASSARLTTASATIQKIDKQNGMVTLKGQQGRMFEVKPGPDVDLNKLKVNDRVTATYYEEVAVAIQKASQGGATKMTETRSSGGGAAERQATVTARIVSVQPKSNTVTIKTPNGNVHTLKVNDPNLQAQLPKIKAGDNLDVTYTEALAVSLEPRSNNTTKKQ